MKGRSELGFVVNLNLSLVLRWPTRGSTRNLIPTFSIFHLMLHVGTDGDFSKRARVSYYRDGGWFALQLRALQKTQISMAQVVAIRLTSIY